MRKTSKPIEEEMRFKKIHDINFGSELSHVEYVIVEGVLYYNKDYKVSDKECVKMAKANDSAAEITVEKISVVDTFNDYLYKVFLSLRQADTLTMVLQERYFDYSAETFEEDRATKALFLQASYEDIQVMLDVIRDNTFEAKKIMQAVMDIDIKNVSTKEKPTDEKANCA